VTQLADGTFAGQGGVEIFWQRATPDGDRPRGVVLIVHGYAEHLGRYREFVDHLGARGIATAALDHRGHGRSGGPRGHCRDFAEMVADLRTLADMTEEWWPGVPRVLFGHSMGGLIGFLYLLRHPDTVRAGAVTGPAFRVPDAAPRSVQAVALLLGRIVPRLRFKSKLDQAALSRDPAVGAAYVADPLVHRAATAGFFRAIKAAQGIARVEAHKLRIPLLILQGDADRVVDPAGAADIAARLTSPHQLLMLPGYFHELLNEPKDERKLVLDKLDAWFERWLGASSA
jgi:alpha-beta hydrolase superfamily lysophospholipase